ncbi:hypothetical protein SCHPADRAFT_460857 [Schizopora paradoxa]|uniref:F-box domain-containing protein n=1 Tax=Schizopora paradoxa TaxID=27342 RepID=A0A0H2RQ97_9AGAM|nr:hypothetical protein SCHPADRAFT_460857 [Schizopora paradoxa]
MSPSKMSNTHVMRSKAPLPLHKRIAMAKLGKHALDKTRRLDRFENPHVRKTIRLGKLSKFLSLPLDIVLEVASFLQPLDLLHLSRTNTQLRSIFMSKTSKYVWKRTREVMNLPSCPEDVCEPEYASFVFDKDCHVCGASNIDAWSFSTRIRLCKSCRNVNFLPAKKILEVMDLPRSEMVELLEDNVMINLVCAYEGYGFEDDDIEDATFFVPDVVEMVGRYSILLRSGSEERLSNFLENRQDACSSQCDDKYLLRVWEHNVRARRQEKLSAARERRRESIIAKLHELGYSNDDLPDEMTISGVSLRWADLLDVPHDLNPRIWKSIRPRLEAMIEEYRGQLALRSLQRKRAKRWDQLQVLYDKVLGLVNMSENDVLIPSLQDVLQYPSFKELLEGDDKEDDIVKSEWEALLPTLAIVLLLHQQKIIDTANNVVSKALEELKVVQTTTSDAVVLGHCARAYAVYVIPGISYFEDDDEVISLREGPMGNVLAELKRSNYGYNKYVGKRTRTALKEKSFRCSKIHVRAAIPLLKDMGFDWESTSISQMVDMGECFGCARCPVVTKIFTWLGLIRHFAEELKWKKNADKMLSRQAKHPIRGKTKQPYCLDFVIDHDVDDKDRPLVLMPGTFELGHLNSLGEKLVAAEVADGSDPIFRPFDSASCEICWRIDSDDALTVISPFDLKRHIRRYHAKEPQARDAHILKRTH